MDLTIIVVNYNTRSLTLDALQSIVSSDARCDYEVIVVDNDSSDDSVAQITEKFRDIKLIANSTNWGFARANNQGIALSTGRYVLLLNSDTRLNSDTISKMLSYMDNRPLVGASGCRVSLADGRLDRACRRGFPTPAAALFYVTGISKLFPKSKYINRYHLGHLNPDTEHPVDSLVGAFMLVRREVIDQVGLLDEQFFMYGEDIDWCYRIKQAGWGIWYTPDTQITHYKGGSSPKKPARLVREFYRSMYLFYRKHYRHSYNPLVTSLVQLGIGVAMILALFKNAVKRQRTF